MKVIILNSGIGSRLEEYTDNDTLKEMEDDKKSFAIFYLNLKPTQAFIHDILSYGPEVAILTPNNLKEKISSEAKRIARKNA